MCGIFAHVSSTPCFAIQKDVTDAMRLTHRGPDCSRTYMHAPNDNDGIYLTFVFHRLAIVAPDSEHANQPIERYRESDGYLDCVLMCNGEIYGDNTTRVSTDGRSDCETIIDSYIASGRNIVETVARLGHESEYTFVLYDAQKQCVHVVRDTFGIRPLFFASSPNHEDYYFASELKGLPTHLIGRQQVTPGSIMTLMWHPDGSSFVETSETHSNIIPPHVSADLYAYPLRDWVMAAVHRRFDHGDQPVGCLLSGGLDSSLVLACALSHQDYLGRIANLARPAQGRTSLQTFSVGLAGSRDLEWARRVVSHFGIEAGHHELIFTIEEGLQCIREVIRALETYDVTTIRASIPQYLLARYIRDNTQVKVLMSGEGADEVFGGYEYLKLAPDTIAFDAECTRLQSELHYFDNLRTDRTMAAHGLEVRLPFLDPDLLAHVRAVIPPEERDPRHTGGIEKMVLRDAAIGLLPDDVRMRRKDAFSDAVSAQDGLWRRALISHAESHVNSDELDEAPTRFPHCSPTTCEAFYYRSIFDELFPGAAHVIPHQWMPRWTTCDDPSATVLPGFSTQRS